MAHIGNTPFGKTVRTVTSETLTSVKTAYYPTGGYIVGYVDVYVNGVRLTETADFTAIDGTTVTLLYSPSIGDTVDVVTYGSIELANAVRRDGDTLVGTLYTRALVPTANVTYDIGTSTMRYKDLYLSGNTINLGDIKLSTNGTAFSVANTTGGAFPSALANTTITGTLTANATTITGNVSVTGTQFVNGVVTFANSTSNTVNFFANNRVSIGANAAWGDLTLYGTNDKFVSITSITGTTTKVGIDFNPSMSVSDATSSQPQARIYSVDNNYGASIVFANKTQGALGNSLTDKMLVAATGDVMINTSNNTVGGFNHKLIVKQSSTSWTGGVGVESASNDHILSMGCNTTHTILSSSYRTSAGYKPFTIQTSSNDSLTVDASGRVTTPYQPAFHVTGLTGDLYASTGSGYITTWSTVNLNRGSHWNNSTGTFTAPVAGTYIFQFDPMYQHNGGDITFQIYKNAAQVAYNNPHTKDSGGYYPPWHNAPISWIGDLSANDTIRFYWASGSSASTFIYSGGLYTRAWGYLLG